MSSLSVLNFIPVADTNSLLGNWKGCTAAVPANYCRLNSSAAGWRRINGHVANLCLLPSALCTILHRLRPGLRQIARPTVAYK